MKKLLLIVLMASCTSVMAQWSPKGSGVVPAGFTVNAMRIVDQNVIWGTVMEWVYYNFVVAPPVPQPVYAIRSTDGGETWQLINIPAANGAYIYDLIAFDSDRMCFSASLNLNSPSNSKLFFTEDGGLTWSSKDQTEMQNSIGLFLHNYSDNEWLSFGYPTQTGIGNQVAKTLDGGQTWNSISTPLLGNDGIATINGLNGMAVVGDHVYIATYMGYLYKSADRGQTWQKINTQFALAGYNISFIDSLNGVICTSINSNGVFIPTTILSTSDGGQNWSTLPSPGREILNITTVPGMPNTYVGVDYSLPNSTNKGCYISYDNCNTWSTIDTTYELNCIRFLNQTFGFATHGGESNGTTTPAFYKWTGSLSTVEKLKANEAKFELAANPISSDVLKVAYTITKDQPFTFVLTDLNGRVLKSENIELTGNTGSVILNLPSLPAGSYQLSISGANFLTSIKVIAIK